MIKITSVGLLGHKAIRAVMQTFSMLVKLLQR